MSELLRWGDDAFVAIDYCEPGSAPITAADSWLVSDGMARALPAHRARFERATGLVLDRFWPAMLERIPAEGQWFPRVELSGSLLNLRLRPAPELHRTIVLATWAGDDPRRVPETKGPDFERLAAVRTAVQPRGAGEAVLLSADGFVVDGTTTALMWWRGDVLCVPALDLARVPSVTAATVRTLAAARGLDVVEERVTPDELDGCEIWAVNALHGIRIVTDWVDGPDPAELPGRLTQWRRMLDALVRPIVANAQPTPGTLPLGS